MRCIISFLQSDLNPEFNIVPRDIQSPIFQADLRNIWYIPTTNWDLVFIFTIIAVRIEMELDSRLKSFDSLRQSLFR